MKIKMYTDGACSGNPGPGGWAVVVNTETECKQYYGGEPDTTNNRMELTAVIKCLKAIVASKNRDAQFEIYTDSAYVVNAINHRWLHAWGSHNWHTRATGDPVKNQDLWKMALAYLNTIERCGKNVTLIKIKGHNGNTFNELCDKMAREAAMEIAEKVKIIR